MKKALKSIKKFIKNLSAKAIAAIVLISLLAPLAVYFLIFPSGTQAWYETGGTWYYRKKITIDDSKVSGTSDLSNFPVMIRLSDSDLASLAQSDGDDILFTSSDGTTKLDHEIEEFSSSTGDLIAWVEIPTLSYNSDTEIFLYYGNPSASDQQNATGVWDSNFAMVQNLEETTDGATDFKDSTSNNNDSSSVTLSSSESEPDADGKIDGAVEFDDGSDQIIVNDSASLTGGDNVTIESWIKLDRLASSAGHWMVIADKAHNASPWFSYRLYIDNNDNTLRFAWSNSGGSSTYSKYRTALSTDTWYHVVAVKKSSSMEIYVNGVEDEEWGNFPSGSILDSNSGLYIGDALGNSWEFDGIIDNLRISTTDRSSDWIKTTFNNQNDPDTFYSVARQESKNKPARIVAYWKFDEGVDNTCAGGTNDACDSTISGYDGAFGASGANPTWKSEDFCVVGKCLLFDGTDDTISVSSTISSIKTVSFWVKVLSDSTTEQILDLNGSDYITSQSGSVTVNGFGTETVYVDGVASATTLTPGKWHHVAVATSTGISASALNFAKVSTNYGNIYLDEVKFFDEEKSAAQIKADFNAKGSSEGVSARFSTARGFDISDGLAGYWPLNDNVSGDAQTVSDESGNGNNGTTEIGANATGMDCTGSGKFGRDCSFDGSDDYVEVSNNASLNFTDQITVSAWINPGSVSGGHPIVTRQSGSQNWTLWFSNDQVQWRLYTGGTNSGTDLSCSSLTLSTSTWHHVIGTWDGQTARIFIDGEFCTEQTVDGTLATGGTIRFARDNAGTYGQMDIDEVRVYKKSFSPQMARSLYQWAPSPVAYYNFDENTGTSTLFDRSSKAFNGTLNSITDSSWIPGRFGSGLSFDGSADFVDFTSGPSYVKTIAFWIKPETTTEYFVNVTSNTDYISASSGTISATGFSSPTIYVNGSESTTLTADEWQHVAVVTDTAENASNLEIGRTGGSNYLEGIIDEVRIYDYVRTPAQIVEDLNAGHPLGGSPVSSKIIHYKLDKGYGSISNSAEGHGSLLGTRSGAAWINDESVCKFNFCLEFDGSDDVVTVNNDSKIDFDDGLSNGFTFTTWFYAQSDGESNIGQIFEKGSSTYCRTDSESAGKVDIECSVDHATTDASVNITSGASINTWHHLALVHDGENTIEVYIDGEKSATDTGSGGLESDTNSLKLGGNTGANFDGYLDEFKVYSAALSPEEIKIDYNFSSSISFSQKDEKDDITDGAVYPVAYLPLNENYYFDDGDPLTIHFNYVEDISGGGYRGLITSESEWVPGKKGSALKFNGLSDYIDIGTGPSSVKSVSFWVYPETNSEPMINITSTTDYISASSGTISATGFSSPTIYVNGKVSSTLTAGEWQHVVVTTATAENADNFEIGRTENSNYFEGIMDDIKLWSDELSLAQVAYEYNRGEPLAHWKLDDCSGTVAGDSSGNGYSGTLTIGGSGTNTSAGSCDGSSGEAWFDGKDGRLNYSLEFDGTDDKVDIGNISDLNFERTDPFSVSAWIKTSTDGSQTIIAKQLSSGGFRGWNVKTGSSGYIFFQLVNTYSSNTLEVRTTNDMNYSDGDWHHIAVTYDGSSSPSGVKIYFDGRSQALTTTLNSLSASTTTSNNVFIGARNGADQFFTGQIDDVQVYNFVISSQQVLKASLGGSSARFGPATGSP